jgi:hypothetical protein
MSTSNCGCGSTSISSCGNAIAELPRYYPRQMITPDDLTLEQNYFRDRMRRHNRLLHGWGVVCGALVCPATVTNPDGTISLIPWKVVVQTGYILGPYGDEIILDCVRTVDVRTSGVAGVTGGACIDAPDPWCTQVYNAPPASSTVVYIAVQYQQTMMRPVRVQPSGCGCGDSTCEYSRWHDGYQIGVLQDCPDCNQPAAQNQNVETRQGTLTVNSAANSAAPVSINDCPDCSCGPWVGLAIVQFDQNGKITVIDNCVCRRIVVSLSQVTRSCKGVPLAVTSMTPVAFQGNSVAIITVVGAGFACGTTAAFGANDPLVVTQTVVQDSQTLQLTTTVNATPIVAATATQSFGVTLTATNMDGSTASLQQTITITATASDSSTNADAQIKLAPKSPKPPKLTQPKTPKP